LYGIVLGVNDFQIDAQARRSRLCRTYLLDLIVIVIDGKKNKPELFHRAPPISHATFITEQLPGCYEQGFQRPA
jgi:hypothetical protein